MMLDNGVFDRHASIVISPDVCRTNPDLKELAEQVAAHAGLTLEDVTRMTVWRTHAALEVYERTADGKVFIRDDETVKRSVGVSFDAEAA